MMSDPGSRYSVLDVPIDAVDVRGAVERIRGWLDCPQGGIRHIVTVNPEFVIAARRHPGFARALQASDLATADGVGILLAARVLSLPIRTRLTGVDLVECLAGLDHPNNRIFLLGAGEGVAALAAERLRQRYPHVQIVGTFAGRASRDGFREIEARLEQTRPTVLLVAFGHPRQDLWIAAHREQLGNHGILIAVGVGGAFDYLSGRIPRAPRLMRRLGLEWLYRLVRQPWRWRRQLALPWFVVLIVREWLGQFRRGR